MLATVKTEVTSAGDPGRAGTPAARYRLFAGHAVARCRRPGDAGDTARCARVQETDTARAGRPDVHPRRRRSTARRRSTDGRHRHPVGRTRGTHPAERGGGTGKPRRPQCLTASVADGCGRAADPRLDEASDGDTAASPIAPLNPGPQNPPPPPTAAPADEPGQPAAVAEAPHPHTVRLPDGAAVEAPNEQAAEAAQNAIDAASTGWGRRAEGLQSHGPGPARGGRGEPRRRGRPVRPAAGRRAAVAGQDHGRGRAGTDRRPPCTLGDASSGPGAR